MHLVTYLSCTKRMMGKPLTAVVPKCSGTPYMFSREEGGGRAAPSIVLVPEKRGFCSDLPGVELAPWRVQASLHLRNASGREFNALLISGRKPEVCHDCDLKHFYGAERPANGSVGSLYSLVSGKKTLRRLEPGFQGWSVMMPQFENLRL